MEEKCENCRFFRKAVRTLEEDFGECRRHQPGIAQSIFPIPGANNWCGEYQPQEPESEK